MATATLLTQGASGWESANTDGFTSASITPGTDCALVCLIGAVDDQVLGGAYDLLTSSSMSSSGSGPTWTLRTNAAPSVQYEAQAGVFTAVIGGSSPGTFTVSWNANPAAGGATEVGAYAYAIYKVTGHDTGTTFGGKIAYDANAGNGAASVTLDAAPASADITLAMSFADEDDASGGYGAAFDSGSGTWTENYDGTSLTARCAWNVGQRTGSTSTTVSWTDVNTGPHTYESAQVAIVVKASAAAATSRPNRRRRSALTFR